MSVITKLCSTVCIVMLLAVMPSREAYADNQIANKAIVSRWLQDVTSTADAERVARAVAPHVIEHDPTAKSGRQGTVEWIQTLRKSLPGHRFIIKHLLADGDLVFAHSQLTDTPGNEMSGINRWDFFQMDKGLIVEHWVVHAPAPQRSASGNSAFSDLFVYARPGPAMTPARQALQRALVRELSEAVFARREVGMLDRFWAPGYLQHNPYVGNGRAALASVMHLIAPPGSHYRVVRAMSEGDLAVVCSHNVRSDGDPDNEFAGAAVCDMYRVVDLALVEHWDVAQAVPSASVNGNSMFSALYRR